MYGKVYVNKARCQKKMDGWMDGGREARYLPDDPTVSFLSKVFPWNETLDG